MFNVGLDYTDYTSLVKKFESKINKGADRNSFSIPKNIGDGHLSYIDMPNGLHCLIADFKLTQDIFLSRKFLQEKFYVLRFDEFVVANNLMIKIDNEYIWESKQKRSSVLLTSSQFDFACMASKGSSTKSIIVLLPEEWLSKYIDINNMAEPLKKYLTLKPGNYNFAPFDVEYKTLFNEITGSGSKEINSTINKDHIMLMVEKFLDEFSHKLSAIKENDKIKISLSEVRRLMEAESCLIKNFSIPPPSIYSLSKIAAMSTTSLKTKFKKMYGYSLFEYFQKSRMQRAKVMLLSGKYFIKEIGAQLGYSNLSNFTIAFKKEFNRLPSKF